MNNPSGKRAVPLTLWLITDGKPGHRSQLEGLCQALERLAGARTHWIEALSPGRAALQWLAGRFTPGADLPKADLVIVAGHRTHWSGLAARRARGGRLVVLMRPGLPYACFDACIVPDHDGAPERTNLVRTRGALNPMRSDGTKRPGSALIALGGASRHFEWDDYAVMEMVERVHERWPEATITDSRRTPARTRQLAALRFGESYVAWERCEPGWMRRMLERTETAWITSDSVSMIFEALSAGCATGLIVPGAPRGRSNKLVASIAALQRDGMVTTLHRDDPDTPRPHPSAQPLAESSRVAELLLNTFDLQSRTT